jgi:hypothetical protein
LLLNVLKARWENAAPLASRPAGVEPSASIDEAQAALSGLVFPPGGQTTFVDYARNVIALRREFRKLFGLPLGPYGVAPLSEEERAETDESTLNPIKLDRGEPILPRGRTPASWRECLEALEADDAHIREWQHYELAINEQYFWVAERCRAEYEEHQKILEECRAQLEAHQDVAVIDITSAEPLTQERADEGLAGIAEEVHGVKKTLAEIASLVGDRQARDAYIRKWAEQELILSAQRIRDAKKKLAEAETNTAVGGDKSGEPAAHAASTSSTSSERKHAKSASAGKPAAHAASTSSTSSERKHDKSASKIRDDLRRPAKTGETEAKDEKCVMAQSLRFAID